MAIKDLEKFSEINVTLAWGSHCDLIDNDNAEDEGQDMTGLLVLLAPGLQARIR